MRYFLAFALVLFAATIVAIPLQAGEVIDGVVATVNGFPILQSDLEETVHYEAFIEDRPLEAIAAADEQASLGRMIDQQLLRQEMGKDFPAPAPAEVSEQIAQIRARTPEGSSERDWQERLRRYDLTAEELARHVAVQMQISRFVEQRLRPSIQVDEASIQGYYNQTFVPESKKKGVQRPLPLRQVRPQIEEILVQQRLNEELSNLLRNLRQQSHIRTVAAMALPAPAEANRWQAQTSAARPAHEARARTADGASSN